MFNFCLKPEIENFERDIGQKYNFLNSIQTMYNEVKEPGNKKICCCLSEPLLTPIDSFVLFRACLFSVKEKEAYFNLVPTSLSAFKMAGGEDPTSSPGPFTLQVEKGREFFSIRNA